LFEQFWEGEQIIHFGKLTFFEKFGNFFLFFCFWVGRRGAERVRTQKLIINLKKLKKNE
jgi:hypothetical protein